MSEPIDPGFTLPVGTLTLLMADIQGSTSLWEAYPEDMRIAVAKHDEIVSQAIGRFGGVRPRDQGEGDSFFAAFARASDAVACALAIQAALTNHQWGPATIRLRIALHTGEVQLRDEGNYLGQTINRAARLRSTAHGGQTVLSQSTYELVVDKLPHGATLENLGIHRLRDLARHEHIYQLNGEGLPEQFPPLKSLDTHPNNLPVQLTTFVGRERDIIEIHRQLQQTRLLTLTGSGGCGKTRLALQVAADVVDEFPDGVWFVELGSVNEADQVEPAIAAALPVQEDRRHLKLESLARVVSDKKMLIILDNCEHLIEVCSRAAETLLKSAPLLTIISTSREPLQVPGETSWRVPSLSVPKETAPGAIETLTQYEAVQLFVERALKARSNFQVTNDNAAAVADICHRLDGIPLAIELAAARVRILAAEQISAGLSDRFHLLTGGGRTAIPRQQTLQGSVDWSFDLLSEKERILFRRLAVFMGGFTLSAAEEICSGKGLEHNEVLDLLSQLADKSLVTVEETGREARYGLLETIRQYALDRLKESKDEASTRIRHRDFFVGFVEKAIEETGGRDEQRRWSLLVPERSNLQTAREWTNDHGSGVDLMRATLALARGTRSLTDSAMFEEALEKGGAEAPPLMRASLLAVHASQGLQRGDPITPVAANQALEIFREHGDKVGISRCLTTLGWLALALDREQSEASFNEAIELARGAQDPWATAEALIGLGNMYIYNGDPLRARDILEKAREVASASGAPTLVGTAETWLSAALRALGQAAQARDLLERLRKHHPESFSAFAELNLAWSLAYMGEYEEAGHLFEKTLKAAREWSALVASWAHAGLCWLTLYEGRPAEALQIFEDPANQFTTFASPAVTAWQLNFEAEARRLLGETNAARELFEELLSLATEHGLKAMEAAALTGLSRIALGEGQPRTAEDLAHQALSPRWESLKDKPELELELTWGLELIATIWAEFGEFQKAARLLGAIDKRRSDSSWVAPPVFRQDRAKLQAALEEGKKPEDLKVATADGAEMSIEEAVKFAMRGRGKRARPTVGWESLTPMELQVVELVGQGLTNPQIGERLFISKRTVQTHLSRVFAKLGVSTRSELAGESARRRPERNKQ